MQVNLISHPGTGEHKVSVKGAIFLHSDLLFVIFIEICSHLQMFKDSLSPAHGGYVIGLIALLGHDQQHHLIILKLCLKKNILRIVGGIMHRQNNIILIGVVL